MTRRDDFEKWYKDNPLVLTDATIQDEHFAQSLEDLAEQFTTSYDAGNVIDVYLQHDLGSKKYLFGFDVNGLPKLTPVIEQTLTDKG